VESSGPEHRSSGVGGEAEFQGSGHQDAKATKDPQAFEVDFRSAGHEGDLHGAGQLY